MVTKLFQSDRDLAFMKRVAREVFRKFVFPVDVYLYDRLPGAEAGDIYGEDYDKSFTKGDSAPSYSIEAYFAELPDWKSKLTKHGLDEERPVRGHFLMEDFSTLGVRPPKVGDHVGLQGERYKVVQDNPTDYFLNTRQVVTYSVDLVRVRPESTKTRPREYATEDNYASSLLAGGVLKRD